METTWPFQLLRKSVCLSIFIISRTGAMLPGATSEIFSQADNFISNGNLHRIDFVMTPPSLPAPTADVVPANVPAGSGKYDPNAKPAVTVTTATAKGTSKSNVEVGKSFSTGWSILAVIGAIFI